jgi:hypothetical protein
MAGAKGKDVEKAPDATGAPGRVADTAPELLQHPGVAGHPDVEIAERSADVHESASAVHRKVFVIPRNDLVTQDYSDAVHDGMHRANIDGMRQEMVLNGLRPTADGSFVGAEGHPDGASVCLTYEVAAVPAAVATPEQSIVAITVADNAALQEQTHKADPPAASGKP